MTFGSQRLGQTQKLNLIALYNDVGSLWGEVFPVRGRNKGTVHNLTEATGASGNPKRPSFSPDGDWLAFPSHQLGVHVWYKTGANTWAEYDTTNLTVDSANGPPATDVYFNTKIVAFNNAGTLLAVGGFSSLASDPIVSLLNVPTDEALTWNTVPTDTWAGFYLDQWATNTWDSVPTDTWAGFEDDEWETETDIQFTLNSQPLTPSNIPLTIATDIAFSYDDTYMAVAHSKTGSFGSATGCPFSVYKLSGGTYSKLADPADVPSGYYMTGVAWSPDAVYLAVGGDRENSSTTRMVIYKRSGDTFTKLSDPADMPGSTVQKVRFDPTGTYLVVGMISAPRVLIYKRSGDTFTKLTDPADMPSGVVFDIAWTSEGGFLFLAVDATNSLLYSRNGDTFTKQLQFGDATGVSIWPKALNQR